MFLTGEHRYFDSDMHVNMFVHMCIDTFYIISSSSIGFRKDSGPSKVNGRGQIRSLTSAVFM